MATREENRNKAVEAAIEFIGLYGNCTLIAKKNFDELLQLPSFKWMFRVFLDNYHETNSGTQYPALGFSAINTEGKDIIFEHLGIKVIEIHQNTDFYGDRPGLYYYMTAIFFDLNNEPETLRLKDSSFGYAFPEILSLCEELAKCITWNVYHILQENKILKQKLEEFESED